MQSENIEGEKVPEKNNYSRKVMKNPRVEVISYSGVWQREKDSNTLQKIGIRPGISGIFGNMVSILVSIFFFLMGEEGRHGILISRHVSLCNVGIDPVHGAGIGPPADLHGDFFGDLQVICQGRE